jgi:hypothetical protein
MITTRRQSVLISAVIVLPLVVAVPQSARATSSAAPAKSTASPPGDPIASFSANHFPDRPKINNPWLPLVPGANTVLSGTVEGDDGTLHQHSIVATVTDLTKTIDGVRTLVVFERDFDDGQLQESELAFEAQDRVGRVWNIGEYPEEYENGKLTGAPSTWLSGVARATAGVGMLANPQPGTPSYQQGRAPAVDFFDCGKVAKTHQHVCVPVGCFNEVLVIDEWAPLDPEGGHQLKYYAPGVGSIKVAAAGGVNAEVLTLASKSTLNAAALAKIRDAVIAQDRRGYRVAKSVYAHTPPVKRLAACS